MQSAEVWRSSASKLVCERTGLDDPRAAVRYLAGQVLGSEAAIPTDLKTIAKRLNVESVVEEPLPFDGMLVRKKGRLFIKLNSHSHPLRRRFTLAHEFGHILLACGENHDAKWQRQMCKGREVERLCDAAASELLMPEKEVRIFVGENGVSPREVSSFASQFQVSLQAGTARINELKAHPGHLLFAKKAACGGSLFLNAVADRKIEIGLILVSSAVTGMLHRMPSIPRARHFGFAEAGSTVGGNPVGLLRFHFCSSEPVNWRCSGLPQSLRFSNSAALGVHPHFAENIE